MSHEMQSNDVQYGLSMAWHGLTTVVKAIREGFKFEYDKKPITVENKPVEGWYWLAGSDDGKLIGVPQYSSYNVITNSRFWELVSNALEGTGAQIVSLGTFGGRAKRYASVRIGTEWEKFKVDGREFQNLLNFQDAVDGSMPLIAKGANTCIVCANTFAMSLGERGEFRLSLRHTRNMPDKLEGFEKAIEAYRGMTALYKRLLESADETPLNEDKAKRVFLGFLGEGQEAAQRTLNQADRLTELFNTGKGNRGQTVLDAVSAVTDYYTHESSGETDNRWKQFTSSEMGAGSRMKTDFMNRIRSDKWDVNTLALAELVKQGEKTLSLVD